MESIENPVPRTLRVMRFKFDAIDLEAKDTLDKQLALQMNERGQKLAPFAFYATKQIGILAQDYYRSEKQLQRIGKRFEGFREPFYIRPVVKSKELNEYTTRFAFAPVKQALFDEAVSLDPIPEEGEYSWDLKPLPNMLNGQKIVGNYIFVDVPSNALLRPSERKMANRAMVGQMKTKKLWVHTQALLNVRDMTINEKPAVSGGPYEIDGDELEQVG